MPSKQDIEIASAILDEITTRLHSDMHRGGFTNDSVIWLIKAWMKVGTRLRGASYRRQAGAYYIMKREPTPTALKRSKTLLSALEAFESIMDRNGTTSGDFFQRAEKAMLDFVWDYRRKLGEQGDGGNSEQSFVNKLMQLNSMSDDLFQREVVANFERSI